MNFNQGDIIWGKYGSDAVHPIVFISDIDHLHFLGAVLITFLIRNPYYILHNYSN